MKALPICLMVMLIDVSLSADQQIGDDRRKKEFRVLSRRKRFIIFPVGSSFSVATCMTVGVYGNPNFSIFSWALNYGFAYNLPSNSTYFTHPPDDLLAVPFFDGFDPEPEPEPVPTTKEPEPLIFIPDHSHDHHHDFHDDHHHDDHASAPSAPSAPSAGGTDAPASRRKYHVYYQPKYETKPMIQRRYRRDVYRNIESVIDKMGYHGRDCVLQALCESPQIFSMKKRTMVQELIKTVFTFPKSKVLPFEHPELLIYDEAHRKGRSKVDCYRSYPKCGFSLVMLALGKYSEPQNS